MKCIGYTKLGPGSPLQLQQQMYMAKWRVWHARKALCLPSILIMILTSLVCDGVGVGGCQNLGVSVGVGKGVWRQD